MPLLAEPVELAQAGRNDRGILALGTQLPAGWENGIIFNAVGCREPEIVDPCTVFDSPLAPTTQPRFDPVYIRQSASCSMLSQVTDLEDRASDRLISTTDYGLGLLLSGGVGDNPSFADGTNVHASAVVIPWDAVVDAVSCLEQGVADVGFGGRAFLHAPPRAAAYLKRADLIDDLGRSPAGHQWIISAGYPVAAEVVTLWATGQIWSAIGSVETFNVPGWRQNTDQPFKQRLALAAFDPCLNLNATFPVPACTPA